MTCIVALKEEGNVIMGADSAGVGGYSVMDRLDPKIYRVGEMLIGFTSSFRMGQLLGYNLSLPQHHADVDVARYMHTLFIDAVRGCLKSGGYTRIENGVETGGVFLCAYRGRIFFVDSDFQVGESRDDYAAVGCGFDLALGSLYSTKDVVGLTAYMRVGLALGAAERFSAGVRGPFNLQLLNRKALPLTSSA